ncbi:MAG TPA: DinB family protein [Terriglobales bacterium]|nr:DinB family protein [Terriglobales bacterium]
MSESARIAELLRRAFAGDAWHGDSVLELLAGVNAATAANHPIASAHSIWELVLHIAAWDDAVNRRIVSGKAVSLSDKQNFPPVRETSEAAWKQALKRLGQAHEQLVRTVAALPDPRLEERVPGKNYNIYFMLHGVTQHELYHAGQIAILKKAG